MMKAPDLEHFCDLIVELAPIRELGLGRAGRRRIIPIIGGTARGPRISGRILSLGADWQTIFHDDVAELDTRYAIETDGGDTIEIVNFGYRHGPADVIARLAGGQDCDPAEYYMRTHARLETGAAQYAWVNRTLFVGTGARRASSVEISLFGIK
jgi:hypothetical protein